MTDETTPQAMRSGVLFAETLWGPDLRNIGCSPDTNTVECYLDAVLALVRNEGPNQLSRT
jgi:hypothetical protein